MPITIQKMSNSDFIRGFEIISDAFAQDQEFINIVYPNHETPEGRKVGAERLLATQKAQPYTTFIKAVDDSGEMLGIAEWSIFQNHIPDEAGFGTKEYWDDEQMADYADAMLRQYFVDRRNKLLDTNGNLVGMC